MKGPGKILPLTLKNFASKPTTVSYPAAAADGKKQFPDVRGMIVHNPELCVGCTACMRDCPSQAIEIVKVADKQFKAIIRMDKCIFCAQCVDTCPKGAQQYTKEFELAAFDKAALQTDSRPDA